MSLNIKIIIFFTLILLVSVSASYGEKTKIQFLLPSGATTEMSRMYLNMIKDFEKKNSDIDVILKPKSNYNDVLNTAIKLAAKNKGVGVIAVEISELLTLKDANAIITLDDLMKKSEGGKKAYLDTIIPGFLANSYGDDQKLYGIPLMRSTPVIYYNMDILNKAGITTEQLPDNWTELTMTLKKLKKATGKAPFVLAPTWYGWLFEAFVRQSGGALSNKDNTQVQFDDPATIEALSFWKKLLDEGLMKRHRGSWKSTMNLFSKGNTPIIYYSSGGMGHLVTKAKINWMTKVMPKNKFYGTSVGAANLFISKHMTPEQEEASWKLIQFLTTPHIQAQISNKSGYFPVVQEAFDHPLLKKRYSLIQFKEARKQLDYANAKIMTRNYMEIRKILKDAIDRTLDENMPAKESLKIGQKEAQKWLK